MHHEEFLYILWLPFSSAYFTAKNIPLYIFKNVFLFPSNLISPLSVTSEASVPQNVKDGLLKQCISSIPCMFKSVEKIILYKINFSLVYM
jgi:hypothetical protein